MTALLEASGTTRGLRGDIAWRWDTTDRDDGSDLGEIDISATFDF